MRAAWRSALPARLISLPQHPPPRHGFPGHSPARSVRSPRPRGSGPYRSAPRRSLTLSTVSAPCGPLPFHLRTASSRRHRSTGPLFRGLEARCLYIPLSIPGVRTSFRRLVAAYALGAPTVAKRAPRPSGRKPGVVRRLPREGVVIGASGERSTRLRRLASRSSGGVDGTTTSVTCDGKKLASRAGCGYLLFPRRASFRLGETSTRFVISSI